MKALSLWQPWASLIAVGEKRIETRHWPTSYRGPVTIHAAMKWNRELAEICLEPPFAGVLEKHFPVMPISVPSPLPCWLPHGKILAVAELVACESTNTGCLPSDTSYEWAFGDYRRNRYMWRLENVWRLPVPVECRGMQGLWDLNDETRAKVMEQVPREGGA